MVIGPLDVTMTATRRPTLVARTLQSFQDNFFAQIHGPVRLIINIDPIWGTVGEGDEVERIARSFFREVLVRRAGAPSFAIAVHWAWTTSTTPWLFHLEDDWLLNRSPHWRTLTSLMANPGVGQIRLNKNRIRYLRLRRPRFSLNPGLLRREFVDEALKNFDEALDPEKQIYRGPMARALFRRWRVEFCGKGGDPPLVTDIGREWREERQIQKAFSKDGLSSTWSVGR